MKSKRFGSVWDAIEETPQAAASMKARSTLMVELSSYTKRHGLTQAQAADLFGVTEPVSNSV
jgi:predicted XRE-type DNA-binding protein